MKIIILDGEILNPGDISWKEIEALGETKIYNDTQPEDVVERIGDAQAVFTNKTAIDRQIMEACPSLEFIGVLATGYNNIDVKAAKGRHITVCNIPSYGSSAVAQYAMALLLELCHHVGAHSDSVMAGDWGKSGQWCYWNYPLTELSGKTMGIIGFGNIGQKTGAMAQAFGMKVIAYRGRKSGLSESEQFCYADSLEEVFHQSDVISLHCPLFPDTEHIIQKQTISQMKDGVMIINTSRGPLIDEDALAQALISGKVSGAATDVTEVEPVPDHCPLLKAPNVIITPHIAWAARETRQRLMHMAAENLKAYQSGSPIHTITGD